VAATGERQRVRDEVVRLVHRITDVPQLAHEVTRVLRNQSSLELAIEATDEQLMLQTSEGPRGTIGKTMLVARPLSVGPADPALANPKARPIACE
jgi:hypothetical protein